ncbi:VID27-domain-containing protein [Stereum hirsutum FP-91666 SS1]|uniref:VID27-domain-containing protein n=1 Tax=Stereum hirsutum (strain FP-91666) TaxID=721885 RepID=UPI000444A560|nr:VID27-domain-containing protein [Stereum hirsutum FP-91666 SS1]EIM82178.1 VID27-domain-containing protein [Stereum hirsutum FP-91666 SS1]
MNSRHPSSLPRRAVVLVSWTNAYSKPSALNVNGTRHQALTVDVCGHCRRRHNVASFPHTATISISGSPSLILVLTRTRVPLPVDMTLGTSTTSLPNQSEEAFPVSLALQLSGGGLGQENRKDTSAEPTTRRRVSIRARASKRRSLSPSPFEPERATRSSSTAVPAVPRLQGNMRVASTWALVEGKMLVVNPNDSNSLYSLDLERGKIVEQWKSCDNPSVSAIAPNNELAQMTAGRVHPRHTLVGTSHNSLFRIDPRVSRNKLVRNSFKQQFLKNKFTGVTTTGSSKLVVTEKGNIRLADVIRKNAKTALPLLS